jgi:hypothetical protein
MRAPIAWTLLAITVSFVTPMTAQEQITFRFFHSNGGKSRAIVDDADRKLENQHFRFSRVLSAGDEVCVAVPNAHPVNYKYSLDATVDTTEIAALPDITKILAALKALPFNVKADKAAGTLMYKAGLLAQAGDSAFLEKMTSAATVEDSVDLYYQGLSRLSGDLFRVDEVVAASDTPEAMDGTPETTGFAFAQKRLAGFSGDPLQFNDPKLRENLTKLHDNAMKSAKNAKDSLAVLTLDVLGDALAARRDKVRASYAQDIPMPRLCKPIASGKNVIRLVIARAGETGKRDLTGPDGKTLQFFTVEVQSRFQRKMISLDALTLGVLAWSVPAFAIEGDTLAAPRENPTLARPGVMLSLNPSNWGLADDWGLGLGLGLGLGSDDLVTDVLMGVTVSYRNLFRFGVGYGRSRQPSSVRGLKVGQTLPADFGKLDDAVESKPFGKDALYFIVALPGLSLKSK